MKKKEKEKKNNKMKKARLFRKIKIDLCNMSSS